MLNCWYELFHKYEKILPQNERDKNVNSRQKIIASCRSCLSIESFKHPFTVRLFAIQVAGLPLSVVSIGIAKGNKVEVGVVYNPYSGELFTARRGQGQCLSRNPFRSRGQKRPLLGT